MAVCEFLKCTLTELDPRIENPADYITILAYLVRKNELEREAVENVKKR